jgi:hypothetical protein
MSAPIDALKTALQAKAALIVDDIDRLEALALIDEYAVLRAAILALSAKTVASYSIAGRSVTIADLPRLREAAGAVKAQLDAHIGTQANMPAVADFRRACY